MLRIKVTNPYTNWPLIRQTPNALGGWGECQFYINEDIDECDYWVIFDGLLKPEQTKCPPKNTIFIAIEFPAIRPQYNNVFLRQFGTIITYSRSIDHPRVIDTIAPFPWFAGVDNTSAETSQHNFWDYNKLLTINSPNKTRLISVVSSNKNFTNGHRARLAFVDALHNHFGDEIDIFGRGIRDFPDKLDVLLDYKYHIAIENSVCHNGISEKLYDAFLGLTYPIYFGASNVYDYFSKQSLSVIDIKNPMVAIRKIEQIINEHTYEKSLAFIKESRSLVLNNYNLFAMLDNFCCNDSKRTNMNEKKVTRILQEQSFSNSFLKRIKRMFCHT